MTSHDIYPRAQRLYALIPEPLRRWTGGTVEAAERDHLADALQQAVLEAHGVPLNEDEPEDQEVWTQAMIISEALAGFVTQWGCRYGNLDEEVDRAQAALVTSLGGVVHEPGYFSLPIGTPLTVAAIAHLIGWVCILEVPER